MGRAAPSPLGNVVWSMLALLFLAAFCAGLFQAVTKWMSQPNLLGLAGFALYGVVGFWLVAGAWLRTRWSAVSLPDVMTPDAPAGLSTVSRASSA